MSKFRKITKKCHKFYFDKKFAKYIFQEVYILKIIDFWQGTKPWEHFQYKIFKKNVKSEEKKIYIGLKR